ncbi:MULTISPECIES: MBL fold metallo-hydrolase [Halanaerobium]|uniref:Phosphoribosyl 1,2-cyclic phosphate phosphodiesterase n=1 Tax=Halanaerobium kushneri TaxID=56779 RepID=A0A1N7BHT4_9FIRM|nr:MULTISPECIES: MBL fold metallo-hydrolase [Halanaerobium]RCW61963.1 phosphoribosyl 1,2-cyclic phosphate phosphodiesterase [Halanaerobium sp. ST460_2HS_T2]SIR50905.1 phosphoribosyl 1,2-cyclic phosphate phosphodiesterase [Halanaerobium kushneri]
MQITFLGTGTSHGVPVIACDCEVCQSDNPKNKRMRTSVHIKSEEYNLLIDTPPEMRLELINNNIKNVDSVLMTHAHADHIMGFDDIRALNWFQGKEMPVYGDHKTLNHIKRIFPYIFSDENPGGGVPQVILKKIEGEIKFMDLNVKAVPIYHGDNKILAYRINNFAYLTDCSKIPDSSLKLLEGIEYAAVDALRFEKHPTHMSVDQAVELIDKLNLKHGYLTHISHRLDHKKLNDYLPENISAAYDGLIINI